MVYSCMVVYNNIIINWYEFIFQKNKKKFFENENKKMLYYLKKKINIFKGHSKSFCNVWKSMTLIWLYSYYVKVIKNILNLNFVQNLKNKRKYKLSVVYIGKQLLYIQKNGNGISN